MATQPDAPTVEVYDEIAGTPKEPVVGLTYDDLLEMFPEVDNARRELIDGELIVDPPPKEVGVETPHLSFIVRFAKNHTAGR